MLKTRNDRIQFMVTSCVLTVVRSATFQTMAGLAIWFGFAAFMCLTETGLAMSGDMTLLALAIYNILADVLHLPRAPYFTP